MTLLEAANNDATKCGRGWVGTKPPGCHRKGKALSKNLKARAQQYAAETREKRQPKKVTKASSAIATREKPSGKTGGLQLLRPGNRSAIAKAVKDRAKADTKKLISMGARGAGRGAARAVASARSTLAAKGVDIDNLDLKSLDKKARQQFFKAAAAKAEQSGKDLRALTDDVQSLLKKAKQVQAAAKKRKKSKTRGVGFGRDVR